MVVEGAESVMTREGVDSTACEKTKNKKRYSILGLWGLKKQLQVVTVTATDRRSYSEFPNVETRVGVCVWRGGWVRGGGVRVVVWRNP